MKVRDVMSREVTTVPPETPLRDVARLLSEHRISGVPVVDEAGTCVGVVSEADLLPKELGRPRRPRGLDWLTGGAYDREELRRRAARTAGEAMSSPAITIEADRPVREAANAMVDRRVNRLPVTEHGELSGIVTRADLVRAYLRMDDEIAGTVREEILRHTMWLDPDRLDVHVSEGTVRLGGNVDRRSTSRIIGKLVALVEGVVEVRNGLTWEFDDVDIEPPTLREREPGAASVSARERPAEQHR